MWSSVCCLVCGLVCGVVRVLVCRWVCVVGECVGAWLVVGWPVGCVCRSHWLRVCVCVCGLVGLVVLSWVLAWVVCGGCRGGAGVGAGGSLTVVFWWWLRVCVWVAVRRLFGGLAVLWQFVGRVVAAGWLVDAVTKHE